MRKFIFIPLLFISFALLGQNTWYVSPTGDDAGAGTIGDPWKTWGFAFNNTTDIGPGDTVYFRGGVYYKSLDEPSSYFFLGGASGYWGYQITADGTEGSYVHYFNYPGETPILDASLALPATALNYLVRAYDVSYVHFKGLHFRNHKQQPGNDASPGWRMTNSDHVIFENCVGYNIHGTAFSDHAGYDVYYINCDAYNCCDSLTASRPGEAGSGFGNSSSAIYDCDVHYTGCRAWLCSDQGFVAGSNGYVEYDSCWAFYNGALEAGGHGYKMGWVDYNVTDLLQRTYTNCLAVYNRRYGFHTNEGGRYPPMNANVYNNIAYHNGYYPGISDPSFGFVIDETDDTDEKELTRIFRNNISLDNESGNISVASGALYTHSNNTWDGGATVTAEDFVYDLDSATIMDALLAERQSDGSLPEFNYFDLASTSDLIDAGMDVGLPYNGEAPDIGAFEYEAQVPAVDPSVSTGQVWNISTTGCIVIGNNNDDGGGTVSAKGVCYAETENPDLEDDYTDEGGGTGEFNSTITGLSENTTYHVRAYATNEAGTAYGDDVEFTTAEEVIIYVGNKPVYHNGLLIKH